MSVPTRPGAGITEDSNQEFCITLYVSTPLLLLDEPVDFLDFTATEFLYESISAARDGGRSVLLSSHIAESFTRCSSGVHVLKGGALTGPFPTPEDPHDVASLIQ